MNGIDIAVYIGSAEKMAKQSIAKTATILILSLLASCVSATRAQDSAVMFPPSTWKMEAYGTWLSFPQNLYMDYWGYDQFPNVTTLYFYNPQMDGAKVVGWWWLTSPSANATIDKFFSSKTFQLTLTGATGAQYNVSFSVSTFGRPASAKRNGMSVDENKGWSVAGEAVTLQGTFGSADVWELSWEEIPTQDGTEPENPDGGGWVKPVLPEPFPNVPPEAVGAAFISVAVVAAMLYGQWKQQRRTWKQKPPKKVEWKKKKKVLD